MSDMDKNRTAKNTVRHDYRRVDNEGFGAEHQNYPSEAPMLTGAVVENRRRGKQVPVMKS